ncbi:MAG: helix-turn-helix domain-containing protein [Prevotella sp.]|nr:helix-turn-helix domain-containing protein [Prevotella sp.]
MARNEELRRAWQIVESTGINIFLTGKAGTGKTTFLRTLKEKLPKRMIVVAPTGIAAVNAKGVTIHSFFQLPLSPFVPGSSFQGNQRSHFRFSKQKINIIRSIDLLVIDEISMVRADLLDAVDDALRRFRRSRLPFGGVQLLMIGDLQQLAPVVKDDEWSMLSKYYDTMYFFGSHALRQTPYATIELKQVYRQSDERFLSILNKVRTNKVDAETLTLLNSRYIPNFQPPKGDSYIQLTTHNAKAHDINRMKLMMLPGQPYTFKATVEGEFPELSYPTDETLTLKVGAQVMFVKNDSSGGHRYYNGMICTITRFTEDGFTVTDSDNGTEIEVGRETWENNRYVLNEETKEITEQLEGTFTQFPVKTAWAITIHKSQGLTFDRAIIDVQWSFSHGQTYVALSRCKTLEGIVLSAPIAPNAIINDSAVTAYTDDIPNHIPDNGQMEELKRDYFCTLIKELFGFDDMLHHLNSVYSIISYNFRRQQDFIEAYAGQQQLFSSEIMPKAQKFVAWAVPRITAGGGYASDDVLQEQVKKGAVIFANKLQPLLELARKTSPATDNKDLKKRLAEAVENLVREVTVKIKIMQHSSAAGFYVNDYLRHKAVYLIGDEDSEPKKKREKKAKEPKAPKIPTHEISYQLYKEGKTPAEIAMIRQLAVSTVNSHLVRYVQAGEIELSELMPMEHIILGKKALENHRSLKEAFNSLSGQVSYGELNLIIASEKTPG